MLKRNKNLCCYRKTYTRWTKSTSN